jgi:hypothetical protein
MPLLGSSICSSIVHTTYIDMSAATQKIIDSARSIMEVLGPIAEPGGRLTLSERSPNLPMTTLQDLLSPTEYAGLDIKLRSRLSSVLHEALTIMRDRTKCRYWQMTEQLFSLQDLGLSDFDVENRLLLKYETRYQHCLDDIGRLLARTLTRERCSIDSRNTRGGFGDVSPPYHSN